MSKVINIQNKIKVTIAGHRVSQVCEKLDFYKLSYSLGETKSIYSLGLSAQEIFVIPTKTINQSMIESLAYKNVLPQVQEAKDRANKI